jgi:hypothetical protein
LKFFSKCFQTPSGDLSDASKTERMAKPNDASLISYCIVTVKARPRFVLGESRCKCFHPSLKGAINVMQCVCPSAMKATTPAAPGQRYRVELITAESEDSLLVRHRRLIRFPQLTMPLLAAWTPNHWDVSHTDEIVQRVDFDKRMDLVGITANTPAAPHA